MTDKEILAELKKSYNYLYDIRENGCADHCDGQMEDNIKMLDETINNIAKMYYDFYKTLDKEELRCNKVEKIKDERVYISNDISSDYEYYNWDVHENGVFTCEDADYYWYKDEDFINE